MLWKRKEKVVTAPVPTEEAIKAAQKAEASLNRAMEAIVAADEMKEKIIVRNQKNNFAYGIIKAAQLKERK